MTQPHVCLGCVRKWHKPVSALPTGVHSGILCSDSDFRGILIVTQLRSLDPLVTYPLPAKVTMAYQGRCYMLGVPASRRLD